MERLTDKDIECCGQVHAEFSKLSIGLDRKQLSYQVINGSKAIFRADLIGGVAENKK